MKLARLTVGERTAIGVVLGNRVAALASVLPDAPSTLREVLAAGP